MHDYITIFNGRITIGKTEEVFYAYFTYDKVKRANGRTKGEALGNLLFLHEDQLCHLLKGTDGHIYA